MTKRTYIFFHLLLGHVGFYMAMVFFLGLLATGQWYMWIPLIVNALGSIGNYLLVWYLLGEDVH